MAATTAPSHPPKPMATKNPGAASSATVPTGDGILIKAPTAESAMKIAMIASLRADSPRLA